MNILEYFVTYLGVSKPMCGFYRGNTCKKDNALIHIFGQKTSFLTKKRVICFKFCMKDPLLSYPYLVEKYKFCQYYSIVWPKKVNKMVFYPILHEKLMLACPYFIKNTSILSKTHCSQANKMSK